MCAKGATCDSKTNFSVLKTVDIPSTLKRYETHLFGGQLMGTHGMNDAIHGMMEVDDKWKKTIKAIIDLPDFQRLRHIKQLGLADLVFPGAVHTRFSHCIGTAYLAYRITKKLDIEEKYQKHLVLAALLHDIGHGPFSHSFEKLTEHEGKALIRHEDWTKEFLNAEIGEVVKDSEVIAQIIQRADKRPGVIPKTIWDVVSSGLDADRMDYLLRDGKFCGVPYGNYDLEWILHCMKIEPVGKTKRLAVSAKGMGALEHYLLARRLMTQHVYHHPKLVAAEHLLIHFLKRLGEYVDQGKGDAERVTEPLRTYLVNQRALMKKLGRVTSAKAGEKFRKANFNFYRKLKDWDVWQAIELLASNKKGVPEDLWALARIFYERKLPDVVRLKPHEAEIASRNIASNGKIEEWRLKVLDGAKFSAYSTDTHNSILVIEGSERSEISEKSSILRVLADKKESSYFLMIDKTLLNSGIVRKIYDELGDDFLRRRRAA